MFGTLLTLMTGLRIGELCALQSKDISLEEKTLRVSKTMQRIKNQDSHPKTKVVVTSPKSEKSNRIIPLSDWLVLLCKKMLSSDSEQCFDKNNRNVSKKHVPVVTFALLIYHSEGRICNSFHFILIPDRK